MMQEHNASAATQEDESSLEALRRMVVYAREEAEGHTGTMVSYFLDMALQEIDEIMAAKPELRGGV